MYGKDGKYSKPAKAFNDLVAEHLNDKRKNTKPFKIVFQELADEMDVDVSNVMRCLSGEYDMTIKQYVELCLLLRIDPAETFSSIWDKNKFKIFK